MLLVLGACAHPAPPEPLGTRPVEATPTWVGQHTSVGALPDVVATVNGEPVTAAQLAESNPAELLAAEAALSEARLGALDGLVQRRLVQQQATAAGLSEEAWMRQAVESRVDTVTDDEIARFYDDNAAQIGQPLGEVKESLRGYLEDERIRGAVGDVLTELRTGAKVEILLPKFRIAVDGGGGSRLGSEQAPVQIVEFSDFQCPYCARASAVLKDVLVAYGDRVSVVYRHFPLEMHAQAHRAAEAAECAAEQGQFWRFHDELFADARKWSDGSFGAIADSVGLDGKAFRGCLESGRTAVRVDQDIAVGQQIGMNGTPAFYINGILLGGAQPFEEFARVIDEELAVR